jgi:hypothetical protein
MTSLKHHFLLILWVVSIFPLSVKAEDFKDSKEITENVLSTIKAIKQLKYTCESIERINGKMKYENSAFKICTAPYKVHVHQYFPKKGVQCLYVTGKNDNKAKVNPNAFPWVSVNLNPEGSLMLDNHHHSMFDAGFAYTFSLLEYLLKKYEPESTNMIVFNGVVKVKEVECYHLTFTNPHFAMVSYTTLPGETPISIAKKLHINYYSILENNPAVKGIGSIKAGTRITVSNDYASKMDLYIHKEKLYPVNIKVYDNKGLYEEYLFSQVDMNPALKDIDFSESNPEYHFK